MCSIKYNFISFLIPVHCLDRDHTSQCPLATGKGRSQGFCGQEQASATPRYHSECFYQHWYRPWRPVVCLPLLCTYWSHPQPIGNVYAKPLSSGWEVQIPAKFRFNNAATHPCGTLRLGIKSKTYLCQVHIPSRTNGLSLWTDCPPPEDVPLFHPSQIHGKAACLCKLEMIKFRLREGQAHNALNDLPQGLWSRVYMLKFKDRFLRSQGANTHAWNCLKTLDARINAAATRYCMVYHALFTLSPLLGQVGWKNQLCPLAVKRGWGGWVAATSGEVCSTQGLLEVWQGSQGLRKIRELGRGRVFSHSRTELRHIHWREGSCLVS